MHSIFEKVEDLNKQLLVLKAEFSVFLSDKTIPLNERWDLFRKAPAGLVETSPWVWSFECIEIRWYDEFNIDRHETVSLVSLMDDWIAERIEDDEYEREKWESLVPLMKEEILASNTREFTFDW